MTMSLIILFRIPSAIVHAQCSWNDAYLIFQVACEKALKAPNALTGLSEAAGVFYNATALQCFDIFTQYVECADPTGCGLGNDNLAWDYQVRNLSLTTGDHSQILCVSDGIILRGLYRIVKSRHPIIAAIWRQSIKSCRLTLKDPASNSTGV